MKYLNPLFEIFKDISKKNNYQIEGLSQNYIIKLTNKNKTIFTYGNSLPLNNNVCQKICHDKSAFCLLMSKNNIPYVQHKLFKNPHSNKNWKYKDIFTELKKNKEIVIKDNSGSCGINVYKTKNKIKTYFLCKKIFKQGKDVAISPFINYEDEYRLIMFNGKCELCYKKIRPFVIGDGKNKIKNIIKKTNKQKLNFKIPFTIQNKILKKGEKFNIGWKHNLNMNSSPEIITDEDLKENLENIAKKITDLIDIKFCSVDIINDNGTFKVLETNSIVSMGKFSEKTHENYNIAFNIYEKAIKSSFKKD